MKEKVERLEAQYYADEKYALQKERNRLETEILELRNLLKAEDNGDFFGPERDIEELEVDIMRYTSRLIKKSLSFGGAVGGQRKKIQRDEKGSAD